MSWQSYVDEQLIGSGCVKHGAIVGLQGGTWAASPGFAVSEAEIAKLVKGFGEASSLQAEGVHANGIKYMCLNAGDKVIRAKFKNTGLVAAKTNQAVLIGYFEEPMLIGNCSATVEKLQDYLIGCGY
ncbi:PREDICTED: profilin-like [Priapulus caudatus]|uniref:Profilin n=1 Tax=Priapulus caudatus TaxID=37621 RepID=A0ABM1DP80_PRICU|nr:PREDICTED: profilin-like [Priapulus caudatus]XP_014661751.1 PREDICTED: profilin-like [Priapulus caudatus]